MASITITFVDPAKNPITAVDGPTETYFLEYQPGWLLLKRITRQPLQIETFSFPESVICKVHRIYP